MSIAVASAPEATRLIEAARDLGPTIAGMRDEIECERRLPARLFEQLRDLGFFSLFLPRQYGGLELSLTDYIGVVEAVSRLDGSVGLVRDQSRRRPRVALGLPARRRRATGLRGGPVAGGRVPGARRPGRARAGRLPRDRALALRQRHHAQHLDFHRVV